MSANAGNDSGSDRTGKLVSRAGLAVVPLPIAGAGLLGCRDSAGPEPRSPGPPAEWPPDIAAGNGRAHGFDLGILSEETVAR